MGISYIRGEAARYFIIKRCLKEIETQECMYSAEIKLENPEINLSWGVKNNIRGDSGSIIQLCKLDLGSRIAFLQ